MTLDLSCSCGARLQLSIRDTYTATMSLERQAFLKAHEPCRQRPTLLWGGDQV